jgi:hypothetical protein
MRARRSALILGSLTFSLQKSLARFFRRPKQKSQPLDDPVAPFASLAGWGASHTESIQPPQSIRTARRLDKSCHGRATIVILSVAVTGFAITGRRPAARRDAHQEREIRI